jgi:anti-sigma B factor antagonist
MGGQERELFSVHGTELGDGRVRMMVTGEVDLLSAPELERALLEQIDEGRDVLLDLSSVSFIDSSGVQAIVLATRQAASRGRAVALHPVMPRQARKLFDIVGLSALLTAAG